VFVYVLDGEVTLIEVGFFYVGPRAADDVTSCSDIDIISSNADGRFMHKDGTPYTGSSARSARNRE
jgi:uncharacterized cupin superfamily protein